MEKIEKIKIEKGSHEKILKIIADVLQMNIYSYNKIKKIRTLIEDYKPSDKQINKECFD
jgi:hypothetical protein